MHGEVSDAVVRTRSGRGHGPAIGHHPEGREIGACLVQWFNARGGPKVPGRGPGYAGAFRITTTARCISPT